MINYHQTLQKLNGRKLLGKTFLITSVITAGFAHSILTHALQKPGFWEVENWLTDFLSNSSPLPGLMLYILSIWFFIQGLSISGHIPDQFKISTTNDIHPIKPQFGFWATCLGLAILTSFYAASPSANLNGQALAVIWIINICLLVFSIALAIQRPLQPTKEITRWLRTHFYEITVILLILVIAFSTRFWNLEFHPYSFINDEGEMGNNGVCILDGDCNNLFMADGWAGQPFLAFLPTALSISLLGRTATAVRMVSAIIGCLSVLAVYVFTREAFSKTEAWVATILLATLPVHVHFSRLGVDNIIDSLSTTTVLGLLFLGMKRGSTMSFLAAGILAGLFSYTYPGSRLAPIFGLVTLGYFTLRKSGFLRVHIIKIITFSFALIITIAPIAGYYFSNPSIFFARMEGEGIIPEHLLGSILQTGTSFFTLLVEQFMKSFLVFFLTPAPANFFDSPKPYITSLASVFFVLGFGYMIWRIKEERYLVLFVWFFAEIILGSTITGGPPSSQRMLMSIPALTVLIAIGITRTMENMGRDHWSANKLQTIGLIVFVIWVGYKDIRFYHYEYRVGHYFENPTNEFSYETAAIISPLHDGGRLYLVVDPLVSYLSFANFKYFSPDVEKSYLDEVTPEGLLNIQKDKDALFIATPDKLDNLKRLTRILPGGTWSEFRRRYQPTIMLYYSYFIKKADLQAMRP